MGLSFRKSIKLCKGINLNIGKSGVGLSAGAKGIKYSKRKSFKSMAEGLPVDKVINNKEVLSRKDFNQKQLTYILTVIILTILSCFIPVLFFAVLAIVVRYLIFFIANNKIKKE